MNLREVMDLRLGTAWEMGEKRCPGQFAPQLPCFRRNFPYPHCLSACREQHSCQLWGERLRGGEEHLPERMV